MNTKYVIAYFHESAISTSVELSISTDVSMPDLSVSSPLSSILLESSCVNFTIGNFGNSLGYSKI